MRPRLIAPGTRFGTWTVLEPVEDRVGGQVAYGCRCDCGVDKIIPGGELRRGNTLGCRACANRRLKTRHGHSPKAGPTPEYAAWRAMLQRCYDESSDNYSLYGARGISVCESWQASFDAFIAEMGPRPSPRHSLDREDNDGNYELSNCRWALPKQQQRNRRNNRTLSIDGRAQCVTAWAEEAGIPASVVFDRLRKGWADRDAVFRFYNRQQHRKQA